MSITDCDNRELFRFHTSANPVPSQATSKNSMSEDAVAGFAEAGFLSLMYTVM